MISYVPDTDHQYAVSDAGVVYSVRGERLIPLQQDISTGYARVRINGKHVAVHRIVAEAFIPNPYPALTLVGHKDKNRLNNEVGNLFWGDMSSIKCP